MKTQSSSDEDHGITPLHQITANYAEGWLSAAIATIKIGHYPIHDQRRYVHCLRVLQTEAIRKLMENEDVAVPS